MRDHDQDAVCELDEAGGCVRTDDAHHRDRVELPRTMCEAETTYGWGPCLHRHTAPVEAMVSGEVVARLCVHCGAQLTPPDPDPEAGR